MRTLVPRPSGSWKYWNSQPLSSTTPTEETSTSKAGSVTKGRWRLDNEEPGGGKCRGRPLEGNRYVGLALTSDHRCGWPSTCSPTYGSFPVDRQVRRVLISFSRRWKARSLSYWTCSCLPPYCSMPSMVSAFCFLIWAWESGVRDPWHGRRHW